MVCAWPAEAAIFGVPTQIGTNGQVCTGVNVPAGIGCGAAALDPPGYLILNGVNDVDAAGDTAHQMRLFIEVTGATLDVRVFDAGSDANRDNVQGNGPESFFTYQLFSPAGLLLKSITIGNPEGVTQNRLARMSSAAADVAFVALNAGATFATAPGLHELRITAVNSAATDNDRNAFGVDVRGAADAHYNVYTWATDDDLGAGTAAPATDTSLLIGALSTAGNGGTITNQMAFFPNVIRGCTVQTSNYDMDGHATASASLNPILGASTPLTVSPATNDVVDTATVHTSGVASGLQTDVLNYGMYSLQNHTGTQFNIIDWRVADFQGFLDNPALLPPDPADPLRTYLPNGYTGGAPPLTNLTAPGEPVLMASYAYVSGANPPAALAVTRLVVQVELTNSSPASILFNAANDQIVSALPIAGASNLGNVRCFSGTFGNTVGTAVNGGTFARCNFSGANFTLASGSSVILSYQFDLTPPAAGTHFVTRVPAVPSSGTYNNGGLGPNTTTWAQYSRFPGGTTKAETLGPICDLRATTGSVVTRASLAGLRVDPSGEVEFATMGQRRTAAFNLYATHDPSGRGERTLLTPEPLKALVPDSLGPLTYRARTGPVGAPYVLVEEIETNGRSRLMGPFKVGDAHLLAALERVASMEQAHAAARSQAPAGPRISALEPYSRTRTAAVGVKVEVDAPGRVTLPLSELRAAGLPARIRPRSLEVTNQGGDVPFDLLTDGDGQVEGIAFENRGLVTPYTETNVFIVGWGRARPRLLADLTRFDLAAPVGTLRVEKDRFYAPGAPEGGDPWLWDFAVAGEAWPRAGDPDAGSFDLPELVASPGALVPVRLRLSSVTGGVHAVEAKINGSSVGTLLWSGRRAVTLSGEISVDALWTQGNALSLEYTVDADAAEGGLLYIGHLDFDARPSGAPPDATYRLSPFAPAPHARRFAGIDYLVVTHAAFRNQADRIAGLKRSLGYRVGVADVQEVYDQYTTGIVDASAVGRFIQDVAAFHALKYVLVVGDDSFDPRGRLSGSQASFVPSLYAWDPEFGRIPSEMRYADVDGDQSPDVAIGRLPVQTAEEADALAEKIARQGTRPSGRQVFAVDNEAPGDPVFESMAEQARALIGSPDVTWSRLASGTDAARQALQQGLLAGAPATHFFGHGSLDFWADEHLLDTADAALLAGSPETVVFAWACESQWFSWPFGPSLGEALLLQPAGGASASFGPTGITDPSLQAELLAEVYPRFFSQGLTLGESVRRAKAAAIASNPGRLGPVVHGFNLLGDPSLELPR